MDATNMNSDGGNVTFATSVTGGMIGPVDAGDLPPPPTVACPSWFKAETLDDARIVFTVVTLGVINAVVIAGNLLVVLAVFASAKLRTVTNFLIVSLAVSDLFVGLAVLPYSITLEVMTVWVFGEVWCQMWLAVDVWLCTASILNLCAISIDRYLAITRPVHYRSIMSPKRVKLLIASVWVLSFIICFPPLVGWNDRVMDGEEVTAYGNVTVYSHLNTGLGSGGGEFALHPLSEDDSENDESQDVLVGNFSAPFTEDSPTLGFSNRSHEEIRYIVRNATSRRCSRPQCALISNQGYVIYSALGSFYIPMLIMLFFYWKIYLAALRTSRALKRGFKTTKSGKVKADSENLTLRIHRGKPVGESSSGPHGVNVAGSRRAGDILVPRRIPTVVYHHTKDYGSPKCFREDGSKQFYSTTTTTTASPGALSPLPGHGKCRRTRSTASTNSCDNNGSASSSELCPEKQVIMDHLTVGGERNGKAGRHLFSRISKRNARWHAKRFRTEAKATKTVGIIVGGFILCWLPFFTVYLIRAFCEECIPDLLFSVFFWLGYCNSAVNPFIYGLFSKDFRFAFKKILCRCKLKDDGVTSLIRQIHLPTFFEEEDAIVDSQS